MQGARSIKHLLGSVLTAGYNLHLWDLKGFDYSKFSKWDSKLKHVIFRPNSGSVWGCMSLAGMARSQISGEADHIYEFQNFLLNSLLKTGN